VDKARQQKILIVEDESSLLAVLADKFRREGFFVWTATDGEEGLATAIKNHPQLVILDLVMPSMDGMAMLKKLREDKWGQNAPVLILSNLSDTDAVEQANGRGVIDFLVKSNWGLDDVVGKVREVLKKSL
jgi:DNA-binding response OmpR family regulator